MISIATKLFSFSSKTNLGDKLRRTQPYLWSQQIAQSSSSSTKYYIDMWIETLSDEKKEKMRFIQNEISLFSLNQKKVPLFEMLTIAEYDKMLAMSNNQRHKFYDYLGSVHRNKSSEKLRKAMNRELRTHYTVQNATNKISEYGIGKKTLIPMIRPKTLAAYENRSVLRQMILGGPKMIFDLGFDTQMSARANVETARQLKLCIVNNRKHQAPFVLHFCNYTPHNILRSHLTRMMPNIEKIPLYLNDQDYCDIFPKEKLVVLSPDSPNILDSYNPHDYYVISALVDRGDKVPFSMTKAKKLGLRTARLPVGSYRQVRQGNVFTLDQILNVFLEVRHSKDWNKAFQFIAPRKIK